jgi:tetratricopeptide (TPR) repeat protein
MGALQHLLGDQAIARRHTEHMLANFNVSNRRSHELIRLQFDQRTSALGCLARILWFQGFPNKAIRTAERAVDEARDGNQPLSLCYILAVAVCPVMLWVEDLAAAEHYIAMLLDYSARYALSTWGAMGQTLQGILVIRRGELGPGLRQLGVGFDEWLSMMCLCELAAGFAHAGRIADGLATTEQAIERAEHTKGRWLFPDLLRIRGELLLLQAAAGAAAAADDHFRQALDWARRQGALSLELRAATSLARLLRDRGSSVDARAVLQPVYDRFTEGFDMGDLKAAKALLDTLE